MNSKEISTTQEKQQERNMRIFINALKKLIPKAHITLNYSNNWELLVAVMLSAQCTDKMVNIVTEELFSKYKTLDDYIDVDLKDFEKDIYSTGFYRNKAKNIVAAAKMIKEKFGGEIPKNMDDMLKIPGVARKTANVVLGNAYGVMDGIAVDTHMKRVMTRMGFTDESDPDKIERDLLSIVPEKERVAFSHRVIEYGRRYCDARAKVCPLDGILDSNKYNN